YRDYLAWLARQDQQAALAYWKRTLAGFTAPTPLGIDRAASAGTTEPGYGEERLTLSAAATAALLGWARRQRLTLNSVVQGAYALVLARYSGTDDVVFGVTVSGRPAALMGAEAMVGLLINSLPARVQMAWQQP